MCGVVVFRWGRASWSWSWTWTSYRTHRYKAPHILFSGHTTPSYAPSPIHRFIQNHHSKAHSPLFESAHPSLTPPSNLPPLSSPLCRTWVVWATRSTTVMGTTSSGLLWWVGPAPPPSPPISRGSTAPPLGSPSPHPSRYGTPYHATEESSTQD